VLVVVEVEVVVEEVEEEEVYGYAKKEQKKGRKTGNTGT
jgi:phosphoribosylaminoimidazole carboxylase (NCAIR synthetase)